MAYIRMGGVLVNPRGFFGAILCLMKQLLPQSKHCSVLQSSVLYSPEFGN